MVKSHSRPEGNPVVLSITNHDECRDGQQRKVGFSKRLKQPTVMTFKFLIRDSIGWSLIFFTLVIFAVCTQLTKTTLSRSLPVLVRALLKAAPALFLAGLCWNLGELLPTFGF